MTRLQLKVIEREPDSIEDSLNVATTLEAYESSLMLPGRLGDAEEG